jgi:hypothetical protein
MTLKSTLMAMAFGVAVHGAAWSGPGHDHGDEAPQATAGAALPRFAASSDLFELVGVLDGKALTLYLDRAATNEPVPQASLELELAGAKLNPKPLPDGSYAVELAQALGEGVHPVTATVTAGDDVDLLAGELDVHSAVAPDEHAHWGVKQWGVLVGSVLLGLAVLVGAARFMRKRAAPLGVAA